MKKKIYLICNAHLDPVWLWQWEEGLAETLSTFRIAADFCKKHKNFVFNHNESILYQWIEEHDPLLFKRIKKRVKEKKWHIAGGSYLQPDLNSPSGESHIRQFLYGKAYFRKTFGVEPTTAYNFDPFGQPEGYQDILAGCGFDSYIFCRPDYGNWELPVGAFWWQGRSEKKILARRNDDMYLSNGKIDEKLEKWLDHYKDEPETMILWGIGNHGGGISEEEYKRLKAFQRAHKDDYKFIHSTPEAFFKTVKSYSETLQVKKGEFQNILPGCYTSMSRVKRSYRQTENLMQATEALATCAWWLGKHKYPKKELDRTWKDILFAQFHDILPGSGIPPVEQDALSGLAHCRDELRRLRAKLFITVLKDMPASEEETSIFFWNPHGFPLSRDVECEYHMSTQNQGTPGESDLILRSGGKPIKAQREKEHSNLAMDWRIRISLPLALEPYGFYRVDATYKKRQKPQVWKNPPLNKERLQLKSKSLSVHINPETGLVDWAGPSKAKVSCCGSGACLPMVFADRDHSWTSGDPDHLPQGATADGGWGEPAGTFRLADKSQMQDIFASAKDRTTQKKGGQPPLAIIEDGAVRTIVEAVFVYHRSYIVRRYIFSKHQDLFEFRDRVFWQEKDSMLKIAIPLNFQADYTLSETPYSAIKREKDDSLHRERSNQRWVAAAEKRANGKYIGVVNRGSYAHSLYKNKLYLSVLRSPAYTSFDLNKEYDIYSKRFVPRQEQGEHEGIDFGFVFDHTPDESKLSRLAAQFNVPPQVFVYYPRQNKAKNRESLPESFLQVLPAGIRITAIKKAEKGNFLLVRLQELTGQKTTAALYLKSLKKKIEIEIDAWSLQTLKIHRKTGEFLKVNLIEQAEK
jgi:alpha-mannosidase